MEDEEENNKLNIPSNINISNINPNTKRSDTEEIKKYKINGATISSISYKDNEEKKNRTIKSEKGDYLKLLDIKKLSDEIKSINLIQEEKKLEKESKIKEGYIKFNNFMLIKYKNIFMENLKKNRLVIININEGFNIINKRLKKIIKKNKIHFYKKLLFLKNNNIEKKSQINPKKENNKTNSINNNIEPNNDLNNKKINKRVPKVNNIKNNIKSINNKNNYSPNDIKLKKLEFIKNRENKYIQVMDKQKQKKEEIIQSINYQIQKYKNKLDNSFNKNNISNSNNISIDNISKDKKTNIEHGIEIFQFMISNNIINNKMNFFYTLYRKYEQNKKFQKRPSKSKIFTSKFSRRFSTKWTEDNKFFKNKKKKNEIKQDENKMENVIEIEEDQSENEDIFIQKDLPKYNKKVDKSQLVEYDLFYKEQFFKNEVFLYDAENIEDKVEAEIEKEMSRLEIKRKLIEKKKLKEVNDLKNLDNTELEKEIDELQKKYDKFKQKEEPKVELELNNTEGYLHNGRMLGVYFKKDDDINFPHFSMESEKEIGAREIIDFKVLRKEEVARRYYDYCCCLEERKKINKLLVYARYFCRFFVDNWIFDNLSLLIIIANTILILISDPTDPNNIGNSSDNYFLYFYTFEALLKIITFTFISAEDAYIKDYWNILDFFVVIVGWISFILERVMNGKKISGLAGLRAFRILRPLKTVKRFKGLKKLVTALLASIGHLGETSIILFFFFLIFSIAGTQMWQGIFYRRCMSVNYGYLISTQGDTGMCSFDSNCEEYNTYGNTFICAKGYRNPNSGAVNFDNTLTAFVTVFVMVTLEGWTDFFTYVSKTFKDKIYINPIIIFCYFHVFVFIAAFYLINLFLAVTNSEFEHIEISRKQLKEKKSFFKLIQGKYDKKEIEKKEKKEKERQLKANNNKKSDETLRELYYKITDEAYHIHKNKREIPILYSTVKDMYIMTNKNPEDLYLQALQIDEEEDLLCKDIKRQKKEINDLIKKKKKEEKEEKKEKKKNAIKKEENKPKEKENNPNIRNNKTFIQKINFNLNHKKKDSIVSINKNLEMLKKSSILYSKSIRPKITSNNNLENDELSSSKKKLENLNSIIKAMETIIPDGIEMSIDNAQKFLKERIAEITKEYSKTKKKKRKNSDNSLKENKTDLDIVKYEDLPYEKIERENYNKKRNSENSNKIKKEKEEKNSIEDKDKDSDNKSFNNSKKRIPRKNAESKVNEAIQNKYSKKDKDFALRKKVRLLEQLPIINDLGLSDVEDNLDKKQLIKFKKQRFNKKNLMKQKSLVLLNKHSDLEKDKGIISIKKKTYKKEGEEHLDILKERKVLYDVPNNFNVESQIMRPYSILEFLNKQRKENLNEKRLKEIEKKFKMKKNLVNKEDDKEFEENDNEFLISMSEDGEESFLNFVDNIHKKESMENEILIKDDEENNISNNNSDINLNRSYTKSLLEDDQSIISFYDDLSLDDINILPSEIGINKVFRSDFFQNENIKKNLDLNKLTQKIRSSFFDRQAVNTDINLTTKEQSKHFDDMNRRLNKLLFVDTKKIRGRFRKDDLNVSSVATYKNYDKLLKNKEEELEIIKKKYSEKINLKKLANEPLKEIMKGYHDKIVNNGTDTDRKKNEEKKSIEIQNIKEKEKENDINQIFKKYNSEFKKENDADYDILNSEANLLGAKKTSERINLNNQFLIKPNEDNSKEVKNNNNLEKNQNKTNKTNSKITKLNYFKKIKEKAKKAKEQKELDKKKTFNVGSKKGSVFIFKAKSIEKNIIKYPQENSKDFQIREENRIYNDPLTVEQELIPDNLRGKKYYLNYLYNICDKDLKVKDSFKIDHWEREILGKTEKTFKKKPLPETNEAFFVFNDKKLNLQKYTYMHHKDIEFSQKDLSILTHNLKYMPLNVLEIMPLRLRNYGRFAVGREINPGHIGTNPTSMGSNIYKSVDKTNKTRSGKTSTMRPRNSTNIISSSSYSNRGKYQDEIMFRRNVYERIYKKIDDFNYKTLSHYFLLEDELYFQIIDAKRKEELIKKISDRNREKENRIEVKDEILNIQEFDMKTNSRRYIKWSGVDILYHQNEDESRKKWNRMIDSLEDFNMIIWHRNAWIQRFQKLKYAFYILANNDYFDFIVLSIVIINSVFMALDGNLLTPEVFQKLEISNYIFNSIFILEYVVKFIGLGPFVYYSDAFTYLDTLIIAFAILDMATPNEDTGIESKDKMRNVSSQLSFLRVFRIFRVIRLTKILRRLKSMRLIIVSIKKALSNVSYIICILIMFILIFELLGMSLLSGNYHYQSFFIGFYTTYQILTLENWNSLLYEMWPMNYLCFFYFVAWIFIGNYVIFNLFISILLQSFDEGEEEDDDDLSPDEKIEKMYLLPAYLKLIKKSAYSNKTTKLKAYRKRFDNKEGGIENSNSESFINSKDFTQSRISNSHIDSYKNNSTSFNETTNSYEVSKSIEYKNNDEIYEDDENDPNPQIVPKKIKYWKKVNILFAKNECENSLYFLSQTNSFRIFCMKLILNKWFDRFILLMILCSTARLVVDTFVSGYLFVLAFDILDAILNIIFLLECLVKVFAMGFTLDEGSYLRDNWNKIDIIIVICSFFDFQNLFTKYFSSGNGNSSVQFLKVIRLLRTLRPLRFISHNVQLKLIITSLFDSILPICNALFIVIVVYYMFSIVGISLFYSNLHNCYIINSEGYFDLAIQSFKNILLDYEVSSDMVSISNFCANRYNGIMDTGPAFKFSNIATSIITSYVLSTMEGWPDIMYSYTIYESYYGIYFIVFNLVVAYFFLNLFTGIMFRYFNEAFKREQKIAEDDKKAPKYYDFLAQICYAETHYVIWKKPKKGTYAYVLREIADNPILDNFIMIVIFLNMIFMALNYEGSSSGYNLFLTIVNYVFTGIFIIECILKLLGYGFIPYFHSGWNRFDFFVVISSIVDIAVSNVDGFNASFLKSFQIIRVLRVLRITRVLRLIKSLKGLEKMIQTLSWSLTALANVLLLMLIFFCVFAILGCYFYDNIMYKDYKDSFVYINEYFNVDNFYYSFLLVFRCTTGENWNNIMMELAYVDPKKVSEVYAYVYFIVSNFANSIIMLNLFLMVTLQQYDEFTNKNYNPIEKFESFLIDFNNAWNKFSDDEDKGFRIKKIYVTQFFMELNWKKLNFPEHGKMEQIKKYVTELKLRTDEEDYVYYHDVIYKIINRQMGSLIDRNNPDNNTIFKKEIKVQKQIKKMINKYIDKKSKNKSKKQKHNLISFNPLTSHIYFKLTYLYLKTYLSYYKEYLELIKNMEEQSQHLHNN